MLTDRLFTRIRKEKPQAEIVGTQTEPFGLTSASIISVARSQLWLPILKALPRTNYQHLPPYWTVMLSSGSLFFTIQMPHTMRTDPSKFFTLNETEHKKIYFGHCRGSSWHEWDGQLVMHIYTNWRNYAFILVSVVVLFTLTRRGRRFGSRIILRKCSLF